MTFDPAKQRAAELRARNIALAIATHVGWHTALVGPMLSPATACCLYIDVAQLLLIPTGTALPFALRPADAAAREARSDVLLVASGNTGDGLAFALGLWSCHGIRWQLPVRPWLGLDGLLWLITTGQGSTPAAPDGTAFPLRHGRLVDQPSAWIGPFERAAGQRRAREWLTTLAKALPQVGRA